MKDYLLDLIQHTSNLEGIEVVRVNGTDKETKVTANRSDRHVMIEGKFKTPIADFIGVFGMPNMDKLKTILSFEDYNEEANIFVERVNKDNEDLPTCIHFETKNKDFVNDYRLMAKSLAESVVPEIIFKGTTWPVEFTPSVVSIQRLKKQSQANSEEPHFTVKTENNELKIYFGNPSAHSGNFVFQKDVTGKLSRPMKWPVKLVISILDLPGDKKIRIGEGVLEITVDSGIATYTYLLPAQAK